MVDRNGRRGHVAEIGFDLLNDVLGVIRSDLHVQSDARAPRNVYGKVLDKAFDVEWRRAFGRWRRGTWLGLWILALAPFSDVGHDLAERRNAPALLGKRYQSILQVLFDIRFRI